ncbi:hypothetical protein Vretimale_18229, partial [Volvox reticuliferus]
MRTCGDCATTCILFLFLFLRRCCLAHLLIDSTDVGVHKCEFQGHLGDETVRLYVFLTACVRPLAGGQASGAAMKMTTTVGSGQVAASVQGAPVGAGGSRALALAEAAPPSLPPPRSLQPPLSPNLFLSGFAFMSLPNQPVNTTQLQQPLSTLLWAAERPPGDYRLPQEPAGPSSSSSNSDSSSNVSSSDVSSSESTHADPSGNSSSSSGSGGGDSSSSGGGVTGGGGSDAASDGIRRLSVRSRRGLMQEDVPAPWPPGTFFGAIYEAALQLVNGTYGAISIRSVRSSQQYGVHLSYRDPVHWIANPSLRREPGRLSLRVQLNPDELEAITNSTVSTATESTAVYSGPPAFEIRATGFEGTCSYTPSPSRNLNLEPVAGLPTCGWLDPDRVAYDKSIYTIWRSMQQPNGASGQQQKWRKHRRRRRGKQSPPPPPPPPPATSYSPTKYMVVSPYFNLTPYDFATVLIHHLEYHTALGIQRYLVYIEEGEEGLMSDARLTALAAAGRLQLVRWRELPTIKFAGTAERHPYGSQILVYNHALLSLWHEAAVVAVADLDEYLVTKHPMALEQVLLSCSPHGRYPAAALWIPRRSAICTSCWAALVGDQPYTPVVRKSSSRTNQLEAKALQELSNRYIHNATLMAAVATLERRLWLTASATNASAVQPHHPLEHYRHWQGGWHHKSIMYSHLMSYVSVHLSYSVPSGRWPHTVARLGCAVWVHVETQLGPRVGLAAVQGQGVGGDGFDARVRDGRKEEEAVGVTRTAAAMGAQEAGAENDVEASADGEDVDEEGAEAEESEAEGDSGSGGGGGNGSGAVEGEGEKGVSGPSSGADSRNGSNWGQSGGGGGALVVPVEYRYYWALSQRLGRAMPWSVSLRQRV